ncbi:MAG: right-handed parallel beta-helix repeat-containing protein [Flavobacteriaceae bacterium]|nr:right-handed parallel beta-helix repeat-containing protein [Flavobacteriaceae bacterium]
MLSVKKILILFILFNCIVTSYGQGASFCGPYTVSAPIILNGVNNITISELELTNSNGNCITLSNCQNIIIEKCKLGSSIGNGIDLYNCTNITVVDCRMDSVATAVYANECQGISVTNIEVTNVQGPMPRGQMVQFNKVNGTGNRINFNVVENVVGESGQEDAINTFQSNGTIEDPIQIIGNWIRGGGPSNSGGGILVGDSGGSNVIVQNNILVNPGQYGIAVASGTNMQVLSNQVFAQQQSYTNVGIYVWNQYSSPCNSITVMNNKVHWTNNTGALNNRWDGGNCGIINGWDNNDWSANINSTILPEQIVLDCSTFSNDELVRVFPNPTTGKIFLSPELQNSYFSIFSVDGKKIKSGKIESDFIDLEDLNNGIYLIKIINNEIDKKHQSIKVIKE